jgi:hypothetical protein
MPAGVWDLSQFHGDLPPSELFTRDPEPREISSEFDTEEETNE